LFFVFSRIKFCFLDMKRHLALLLLVLCCTGQSAHFESAVRDDTSRRFNAAEQSVSSSPTSSQAQDFVEDNDRQDMVYYVAMYGSDVDGQGAEVPFLSLNSIDINLQTHRQIAVLIRAHPQSTGLPQHGVSAFDERHKLFYFSGYGEVNVVDTRSGENYNINMNLAVPGSGSDGSSSSSSAATVSLRVYQYCVGADRNGERGNPAVYALAVESSDWEARPSRWWIVAFDASERSASVLGSFRMPNDDLGTTVDPPAAFAHGVLYFLAHDYEDVNPTHQPYNYVIGVTVWRGDSDRKRATSLSSSSGADVSVRVVSAPYGIHIGGQQDRVVSMRSLDYIPTLDKLAVIFANASLNAPMATSGGHVISCSAEEPLFMGFLDASTGRAHTPARLRHLGDCFDLGEISAYNVDRQLLYLLAPSSSRLYQVDFANVAAEHEEQQQQQQRRQPEQGKGEQLHEERATTTSCCVPTVLEVSHVDWNWDHERIDRLELGAIEAAHLDYLANPYVNYAQSSDTHLSGAWIAFITIALLIVVGLLIALVVFSVVRGRCCDSASSAELDICTFAQQTNEPAADIEQRVAHIVSDDDEDEQSLSLIVPDDSLLARESL
jgi:hypothetical protein